MAELRVHSTAESVGQPEPKCFQFTSSELDAQMKEHQQSKCGITNPRSTENPTFVELSDPFGKGIEKNKIHADKTGKGIELHKCDPEAAAIERKTRAWNDVMEALTPKEAKQFKEESVLRNDWLSTGLGYKGETPDHMKWRIERRAELEKMYGPKGPPTPMVDEVIRRYEARLLMK